MILLQELAGTQSAIAHGRPVTLMYSVPETHFVIARTGYPGEWLTGWLITEPDDEIVMYGVSRFVNLRHAMEDTRVRAR